MARKLLGERHILVEHIKRDAEYSMPSLDVYEDCYGICYIVSGDRSFSTPDYTYYIHGGDIGITNKGVFHRTSPLSGEPYERYGIRFTDKVIAPLLEVIGKDTFAQLMSCPGYHIPPDSVPEILMLYEDMLREQKHFCKTSELLISGMLYRLIVTVLRQKTPATPASVTLNIRDTPIMNILSYLDYHYAENPSVEELAAMAGLSASHFMKRFKDCVGSTYISYLNTYKVRLAEYLLRNRELPLTRIAEDLGFCNVNYFSTLFKRVNGKSPLQYRKDITPPGTS